MNNQKRRAPRGSSAWEKIVFHGWIEAQNGCWITLGTIKSDGYGEVTEGKKHFVTHRVSYEHFNGPIPEGLIVRHKCDNPPCMNPGHLEVGTHADNMRDMWERGRGSLGEMQPNSKLTAKKVREIRTRLANGDGVKPLAREYGVSPLMIRKIRNREKWAWLN